MQPREQLHGLKDGSYACPTRARSCHGLALARRPSRLVNTLEWAASPRLQIARRGPAAEPARQHTRMGGVTAVADRQSWLRNFSAATAAPRRLRHVGPGRAA